MDGSTLVKDSWRGSVFVDGDYRPLAQRSGLDVLEKATGDVLGVAGLGGVAELEEALRGARIAQPDWAAQPYTRRAELLRAVAALLQESAQSFTELIMRETGSIRGKAEFEVQLATEELLTAASLASSVTGEILPSSDPHRFSVCERIPVGVVALITPWNFPLILATRVIAPAVALGNSVVLKPSPETPFSGGLAIADLFAKAGAPAGLLQVVLGDQEFSEALVAHRDVDMVHFTGSTAVGAKIAEVAGSQLKRVSLELGGNNSLTVLDDADLDTAVMIGAWSTFHFQGQTCITAGRHLVHRDLFDGYVDRLAERARAIAVGDPSREPVGLGPMINQRQADRAARILHDSVAMGATVVEGGVIDGLFFRPTIVTGITTDMPLWKEEIFAPIAPIMSFTDDDEAIELINDTDYGLVNSVLTSDEERGQRLARRIRSGMVHINDATCIDEPSAPFGGLGRSGLGGRIGGAANLEEFTERRWISAQRGSLAYPY
ncbi:benzaldehyde dehydrogenase [Pseudolysinimonas kribbensis]|uniref:aldehyde dehydrogenase family protein n=1 Tax=Pseudolysinimonas kribbensis TaxID=433641 RepID=UPI0031DAC3CC